MILTLYLLGFAYFQTKEPVLPLWNFVTGSMVSIKLSGIVLYILNLILRQNVIFLNFKVDCDKQGVILSI